MYIVPQWEPDTLVLAQLLRHVKDSASRKAKERARQLERELKAKETVERTENLMAMSMQLNSTQDWQRPKRQSFRSHEIKQQVQIETNINKEELLYEYLSTKDTQYDNKVSIDLNLIQKITLLYCTVLYFTLLIVFYLYVVDKTAFCAAMQRPD